MAFGFAAAIPSSRFSLRAERSSSGALDFSSSSSSPSSSPAVSVDGKRRFVFVVNPNGANGRTGREWKKLLPHLQTRLRGHCNMQEYITSGPSHGTDITREAIREGAHAVIAVGGDGTLHEVVNGFFWDEKPVLALGQKPHHSTALGLIPLGTGSDFARTFGWRNDPDEAVERIIRGVRSKLDVGVATRHSGEVRYFINDIDMHLSAKAGYYSSKYKVFGNLCYVFGALRAFTSHQNRDLKIKINGGEWEIFHNVTALCIGNAKYFGGGMKIAPTADPRSGALEVVILQDFKWYDFILKLSKLYSGLHVLEKNVHVRSVKSVEVIDVLQKGDIYVQTDGEHIGFLPVKCSIMPAAIEFFI